LANPGLREDDLACSSDPVSSSSARMSEPTQVNGQTPAPNR
jgi:hypothetical protein